MISVGLKLLHENFKRITHLVQLKLAFKMRIKTHIQVWNAIFHKSIILGNIKSCPSFIYSYIFYPRRVPIHFIKKYIYKYNCK